MKKGLKITLIITAVIAVLVIAAALLVSPITKNYIEKHSHELIGRSVKMQKLKINIFTGRLHVVGLDVGGVDDSTTFFTMADFDMQMRLLPLIRNRVHIKYITLTQPDLKIYQQGDRFNFDDILAHIPSDTTTVEEPSKPWEIGIYDIALKGGHIYYKDLLLDAQWGLNDLDLQIPGVYFSGEKTDVGVVLNFAEGGSLETQVAYTIDTDDFDIGLKLKDLTLGGMLPYFRQFLDVSAVTGLLSADMHLRGNSMHPLATRVEGSASLADFALHDAAQREVLSVKSMQTTIAEGDLQNSRFRFDKLAVSGFSTFVELTPKGDNLTALLAPMFTTSATAQTEASVEAPAAQPSLHITDFDVQGGRIALRDLTLHKPFEYIISDIRMRSRDFDLAGRNKLEIDARMQKTGAAKLRWEGSLEDLDNQNITLVLSNLGLKDFTPYCEHFTAYPVNNGNLTFRSQNVIRNRYLDGTNHLDMFEPKVDKKLKELTPEMKIPLKLGLYILKDKKGHVKMDLPVKGSLDSPEFSYRKIVLKAIGNVLLKVVTAPFSFLSGHRDNLEYIDIDPRQYAFSSEQFASFDKIAQALQDKPEMKIALTQRINLQRVLPQQASDNLRMAYYNSLIAADSTRSADSTARRAQLSMLELEKIQQIDIRTPAVAAFADSLLRMRGMEPGTRSTEAKALALFREQAAAQLTRMISSRDKELAQYMATTHNLPEGIFRLQPMDSTALQSYTGKDRYTIGIEVDGETVEVASEEGQEAADAPGEDDMTSTGESSSSVEADNSGTLQ